MRSFSMNCAETGKDKRLVIEICMGSSCHLKESFSLIEKIKDLLNRYQLEPYAELKGSLCMGMCSQGVNIKFNDFVISNVSPANIDVIDRYIDSYLKKLENSQ